MIRANMSVDVALAVGKYSTDPSDYIWLELATDLPARVEPMQSFASRSFYKLRSRPDGVEMSFDAFLMLQLPGDALAPLLPSVMELRLLARLQDSDAQYWLGVILALLPTHVEVGLTRFNVANLVWT